MNHLPNEPIFPSNPNKMKPLDPIQHEAFLPAGDRRRQLVETAPAFLTGKGLYSTTAT
jgi:hypothetical protein